MVIERAHTSVFLLVAVLVSLHPSQAHGKVGLDRLDESLIHEELQLPFAQGFGFPSLASFVHGDLDIRGMQNGVEDVADAWYLDDDAEGDQRLPHRGQADNPVPLAKLLDLGVIALRLDAENHEHDENLTIIRDLRGYMHKDIVELTPEKMPNYEAMLKRFFEEHLHADEEVRYCLEGSGYFDVRDEDDRWIRVSARKGALVIIPAGIYHRFTLDTSNYIKAKRLYSGGPNWTAYNRPHDHLLARKNYLAALALHNKVKEA